MKKRNIFIIIAVFSLMLWGCRYDFILPEEVPVIENVSFAADVAPILTKQCAECHKPGGTSPDLTAANAFAQLSGYINKTTPAQSEILTVPGSSSHSWKKFTATESATILKWITDGAKNN